MKGAAIGALAFTVGGAEVMLTPRQAQAQNIPLRTLTADQAATLDAMGETLVPGAQGRRHHSISSISRFRSRPKRRCCRRAFSMSVRRLPISIAPRSARSTAPATRPKANGFAQLRADEQHDFVDLMRQNKIEGWQGPPGPFVYIVLRSDAVDVVYATMDGYAMLGMPYMPHIAPTKKW